MGRDSRGLHVGGPPVGHRPFDAAFALLQAPWGQEQVERIHQEQGGEYDLDLTDPQHPVVMLDREAAPPAWVIAVRKFVDGGVAVKATEAWALVTEGTKKPRAGQTVTLDWIDQGQYYRLSLPEGEGFDEGAALVRSYRQGR